MCGVSIIRSKSQLVWCRASLMGFESELDRLTKTKRQINIRERRVFVHPCMVSETTVPECVSLFRVVC